jgi:hypothetical protein
MGKSVINGAERKEFKKGEPHYIKHYNPFSFIYVPLKIRQKYYFFVS